MYYRILQNVVILIIKEYSGSVPAGTPEKVILDKKEQQRTLQF
jgi:hypothetical protein